MKFLIDNNLSPRLSRSLAELEGKLGEEVVHLKTKFPSYTSDVQWLKDLGKEGGWTVVTCDFQISQNAQEVQAWLESGLVVFFLKGWQNLSIWDQAWQLIKRWLEIKRIASSASPADGYLVHTHRAEIEKIG